MLTTYSVLLSWGDGTGTSEVMYHGVARMEHDGNHMTLTFSRPVEHARANQMRVLVGRAMAIRMEIES